MNGQRLQFAWRTDRGRVRTHNEDAVTVEADLGLVIVADGIGGANAGEVASRLAADVIAECFRNRQELPSARRDALQTARGAVEEANRSIWDTAHRSPSYQGMGTTVVMGYLAAGFLVYAHVGDSRLYRLRDGLLMQLTRDHSLIQEVVDQGLFPTLADAERSGINSNILTRGLGMANRVSVDVHDLDTRPGDLFLFCTDGLSGMVTDEEIGRVLSDTDDDLDRLAHNLIDLACERGGRDNVTVALVRVC